MMPKGLSYNVVALLVMLAFFFVSCTDNERDSQHILPPDQMVKALTEIYLTEQKINKLGLQRDSARLEFERFKDTLFGKVGMSDSVFKRSFDYYMDHPADMEKIYTALVDSLSLMEQRLDVPKTK